MYVEHDPPADGWRHAVAGNAQEGAHLPPAHPHQLQPGAQVLPHLWCRTAIEVINSDINTFGNPLHTFDHATAGNGLDVLLVLPDPGDGGPAQDT